LLPVERLNVLLTAGDDDDDRVVTFEPAGRMWAMRCDALAALLVGDGPAADDPGTG
jgi:hypothetical protein